MILVLEELQESRIDLVRSLMIEANVIELVSM